MRSARLRIHGRLRRPRARTSDDRDGRPRPRTRLTARPAGHHAGGPGHPATWPARGRGSRSSGTRGAPSAASPSWSWQLPPARLGSRRPASRPVVRFLSASGAAGPRLGTRRHRRRGRAEPRPLRPVAVATAASGRSSSIESTGAGPAAVGLNLLFPEADGFSGTSLTRAPPGVVRAHGGRGSRRCPTAIAFSGGALAATPSVIGLAGLDGSGGGGAARATSRRRWCGGQDPSGQIRRYRAVLRSVPDVDGGATGHALLSADVAGGGRAPASARRRSGRGTLVPGLAVEMLRVAAKVPAFGVRSDGGGVRAVGVGDVWIPAEGRRDDVGSLHAARRLPVCLRRSAALRARSRRSASSGSSWSWA